MRRLISRVLDTRLFGRDSRNQQRKKCVETNTSVDKIFGIGYNKTGTTTLSRIFQYYGYKVPSHLEQERVIGDIIVNKNFAKFIEYTSKYDAFQDLPFSQDLTFVACDVLWPRSKFILTVRNEDEWFESVCRHHSLMWGTSDLRNLGQSFFMQKGSYYYNIFRRIVSRVESGELVEDWSLLYDADHFKNLYTARNDEIIKYFDNRRDKLLVIDVTKEANTKRICQFLGLPDDKIIPMPHENRTDAFVRYYGANATTFTD